MGGGVETTYNQLLSHFVRNNMETYCPCTWLSSVNQKNEKIKNWSLLMKIISTVPQLLFFRTTDQMYIVCIQYCIPILWICRQLKHHQLRIRSEIFISQEIILNAFNVLQYHFDTQIDILAIMSLSFISIKILYEFAMLPNVYILLFHQQEEEVYSSSWGNRCTHLAAHLLKRLNPSSVNILVVYLDNT